MKNFLFKTLLLLCMLVIPIKVIAISYDTPVSSNMTYNACVNFQESAITSNSYGYFGHCIKATCYSGIWKTAYYISENMVRCSNGNTNMYYNVMNTGCTQYAGSCIPTTEVKYCSIIAYYDCTKNSDGTTYIPPIVPTSPPPTEKTTSKTTKSTKTTSSTTTATKDINAYLIGLTLSHGNINFNKNTFQYSLTISKDIKSLTVNVTPESEKATYTIENNENINIDKPIKVTVTAESGDQKIYLIYVKYLTENEKDTNNLLETLNIENYNLNFDPQVYTYSLKVNKDTAILNIDVATQSDKASHEIQGNESLKNNSKITISVTSESGNTLDYVIIIKKASNIPTIIIIIIVLGIAGFVGFKVVRKLISNNTQESNNDYEYE